MGLASRDKTPHSSDRISSPSSSGKNPASKTVRPKGSQLHHGTPHGDLFIRLGRSRNPIQRITHPEYRLSPEIAGRVRRINVPKQRTSTRTSSHFICFNNHQLRYECPLRRGVRGVMNSRFVQCRSHTSKRRFLKSPPQSLQMIFVSLSERVYWNILEYLKGTRKLGRVYWKSGRRRLEALADANHGEDKENRLFVSRTVVMFEEAAFSRRSKARACVTFSSADVEYVSLAGCTNDALLLRVLLGFLRIDSSERRQGISKDYGGAIRLASNPICTMRKKYIDVRHHFARQTVEQGNLSLYVFVRKST